MKTPSPDFSSLTPRQLNLLKNLQAELQTRKALKESDPEFDENLKRIQEKIDDLSVKIIRAGAIKRGPDKVYHFPPDTRAWGKKKCLDKPQIQHYFQPDLPPWLQEHLLDWIEYQRLRKGGREVLRKTKVPGLETGIFNPQDLRLLLRFLELRGIKEEEAPTSSCTEDVSPSDSLIDEMFQKSRTEVTDEMLWNVRFQKEFQKEKERRARNEDRPYHRIIDNLVKENLLNQVKTPSGFKNPSWQAVKKMLINRYPHFPWDEVFTK